MNAYEKDLNRVADKGIEIFECRLEKAKGLSTNGWIAIHVDLTTSEKRCILAEEYCHILYNVGDITDLNNTENRKQELYARRKAYELLAPMDKIKQAYENGNTKLCELAEELDVTEEFLRNAIDYYKVKYGM